MNETPKPARQPLPKRVDSWSEAERAAAELEAIPLDPRTLADLRRHWKDHNIEPADLKRRAIQIYGEDGWKRGLALDLAPFRPDNTGGLETQGALHRTLIGRWLSGKQTIPRWVGVALLELPKIALERHRRDAAAAEARIEKRLDIVMRKWVQESVPWHTIPPATLDLPHRAPDGDGPWTSPTEDEVDEVWSAGKAAYEIAAGLSDDTVTARPAHPALADAWDRGWRDRNEEHQELHAAWARKARAERVPKETAS